MISPIDFILIFAVVGIITAFLNIKFDRFFTIIMLLLVAGIAIKTSVEIVLWVVFFGAITVLLSNKATISKILNQNKRKYLLLIPALSLMSAIGGTYLFFKVSSAFLLTTLGILAIAYGTRLIFIHINETAIIPKNGRQSVKKICGIFGPLLSGFSLGFIGTSLKPLKIPFAVKIGKTNIKEAYIGNVIVAAYASLFAIILHITWGGISTASAYLNFLIGASLWASIHFTSEISNLFIKRKWRKSVQIVVGIILILVAIKIFMII